MSIKFTDVPPSKQGLGGAKYLDIAKELKSRPNEWALIFEDRQTGGAAQAIRKGQYSGFPVGEFETTSRKTDAGNFDIYARYVGEQA